MWYLTSETDSRFLYVVPNKDITIGRSVDAQVCNFAISDDASISRKHSTLSVSDNSLFIEDMGSRYGTFVNDMSVKIPESTKVKVNDNDIVRFGKLNSVWHVHQARLITCTSTLKGENLQSLKLCLSNLGGMLKAEWDATCAYLTMPAITLTIKVVLALAQGANIVTVHFWNKCLEAVRNHTPLPDPSKYIPEVAESTLNKENVSFLPNKERITLFAGQTFIFFSRRQMEMYKAVLEKCSATALLLSETKLTKHSLSEQNMIVIQYNVNNASQDTEAQRNQINDIINYLKTKGKRVIADAEIGLAILYCSIDKYCNPDFNFSSEVIKQAPGQNTKPSNVLAQESQEQTQKVKNENIMINESLTPSSKRKFNEEDDEEIKASKKFAGEVNSNNTTSNESVKRKLEDETNGNANKKIAVDTEDDNIFNFLNNGSANDNCNTTEKVLNFTKPAQQKQNVTSNDEDDLFNFVQDKKDSALTESTNNTIFMKNKINYIKKEMDLETLQGKKRKLEDDFVDIAALRGSKLKELKENQASEIYNNVKVKKEDPDDLEQKMNELDLGSTIITVRKDLIVKKEPIEVDESPAHINQQKNFKKFKKVWPVRKQGTVIPKSSMSIVIPDSLAEEITSQSY